MDGADVDRRIVGQHADLLRERLRRFVAEIAVRVEERVLRRR
jgi:hypothetical protein